MNVVDSSGWLEYFADGPNADFFAPADVVGTFIPEKTVCLIGLATQLYFWQDKYN